VIEHAAARPRRAGTEFLAAHQPAANIPESRSITCHYANQTAPRAVLDPLPTARRSSPGTLFS
jgi:hypothetical protein